MPEQQSYLPVILPDGVVAAVDPNSIKWANYSRSSLPGVPTYGLEAAMIGEVVLMRSRPGAEIFLCHKDELMLLARKLIETRQPSVVPKAA